MITCGSERSGIASRGTFLIDQTPIRTSDRTMATTSPRCVAQYSMIALIMILPLDFPHLAVMVVCIDPSDLLSFFTVTVVCQLQAIGMSIVPVYSPAPADLSVAFAIIGAMLPIGGINSVTSTSASLKGLPCASFTVR